MLYKLISLKTEKIYKPTLGKPNILSGICISNTDLKTITDLYPSEQFKVTIEEGGRILERSQETN